MGLRRLKSLEEPPVDKSAKKEAVPLTPAQVMEQTHQEFDQIQKEIKEIDVLIKQSTNEVERLAQRNAQLTNKLRNMETNIDTVPRQDIKEIYTAAQEAQMRLFMMRGQVEQLQSKQEILQRFGQGLQNVLNVSDGLVAHSGAQPSSNMPKINIGEATGIIRIIDAQRY